MLFLRRRRWLKFLNRVVFGWWIVYRIVWLVVVSLWRKWIILKVFWELRLEVGLLRNKSSLGLVVSLMLMVIFLCCLMVRLVLGDLIIVFVNVFIFNRVMIFFMYVYFFLWGVLKGWCKLVENWRVLWIVWVGLWILSCLVYDVLCWNFLFGFMLLIKILLWIILMFFFVVNIFKRVVLLVFDVFMRVVSWFGLIYL